MEYLLAASALPPVITVFLILALLPGQISLTLPSAIRTILPKHHIVVDIDDGYCDPEVACHVVSLLENIGASGVILEDQLRPRKCGHLDGKQIMELPQFMEKLQKVLATRKDMFVVARTDADNEDEAFRRAQAFAAAGADAVLVEAVKDFKFLSELRKAINCPIVFNQIAGGKSPPVYVDPTKRLRCIAGQLQYSLSFCCKKCHRCGVNSFT